MLQLLVSSRSIHRYDFIFLAAVVFQLFLLLFKLETWREAIVIVVFHIVATIMELFKTSDAIPLWIYPGTIFLVLVTCRYLQALCIVLSVVTWLGCGVFLISNIRHIKLGYTLYWWWRFILVFHHFIMDFRWWLMLATAVLRRTTIYFKIITQYRHMPLLLGWFLVALLFGSPKILLLIPTYGYTLTSQNNGKWYLWQSYPHGIY